MATNGLVCKVCDEKIGKKDFIAIKTTDAYSNFNGYAIFHKTCFLYGLYSMFDEIKLSNGSIEKILKGELNVKEKR